MLRVVTNNELLKMLLIPFLASLGITIVALLLLGFLAFPALTVLCATVTGPFAPVVAGVLCIAAAGLITFIAFQVLFGKATTEIKLYAMQEQGITDYMEEKYGFKEVPEVGMLADAMTTARFLGLQIFMMIMTSPLNVTPPGLGTLIWIFCNGWLSTWEAVSDLLPMIGYKTCFQQMHHMFRHLLSYFSFGFCAFGLMLFPVVNVLSAAGIAYGAAILFGHYVREDRIGPAGLPVSNNDNNE